MTLKEFRASQEKGFEAASLVHQDNNTGNVYVLIDDTSLEKGDLVVEVRRYSFDGTRWHMAMMYANNDYQCAMVTFNKCLNSCVADPLEGLKFVCPECKGHTLECIQDGHHVSRVTCIDLHGDHDYGDLSSNGNVVRWQCEGCGYDLSNFDGDITDNLEVAQWILEHCKDES